MPDIEGQESPEMYLKTIYLIIREDGMISMTEAGENRAAITYDKYCFWKKFFEEHGISAEQAEEEACRFEHSMSDEVFVELKASMNE